MSDGLRHPAWLLVPVTTWFVGGLIGALIGVLVVGLAVLRGPRLLLVLSGPVLALVPVTLLLRGLPAPSEISPRFAEGNVLANDLALAGLSLLVVGLLLERRARPEQEAPPRPAVTPAGGRRSPSWALAGLVLASFALGVAVAGDATADPVDDDIARNLVTGRGYAATTADGSASPTAQRMPAVPVLLAASGLAPSPTVAARLLWAAMGAVTVGVTAVAAGRLAGPATGLTAGAILALLPAFSLRTSRLDAVTVAGLLVAVLVLLAAPRVAPTPARAGLLGACAGLLALTRPEGALLGGAIVTCWAVVSGPRWPRQLGVAAITAGLVVAPWLLRNGDELGTRWHWTGAGEALVGANDGAAVDGRARGGFDPEAADAAVAGVVGLAEGERNRRLVDEGLDRATSSPAHLVVAAPARVLRAFEVWDPVNQRRSEAERGVPTPGWLLHWATLLPVLGLAGLGLERLWRAGGPTAVGPPAALLAAVAAAAVLGFGEPLARAAADPVLALLAAVPVAAALLLPGTRTDPPIEHPQEVTA